LGEDILRSNKTRIVKLEQARGARARRYVFYPDEIAEAEAQGLPYILVPRELSNQEWMEEYGGQPAARTEGISPGDPSAVNGSLRTEGISPGDPSAVDGSL
jgi:hypothetical protein